jgi:3-oxocholest-4-en-26-oyl-CoA dehydrogenase beta subunit
MDFALSEEQVAVRDLAAQIFGGKASVARVKEVEGSPERVDRELWRELARANLLGIALPEDLGGSGLGMVELCLVLEQQGRRVAPVPLWPTLVLGALPLAEFGSPEQREAWLPGVAGGEVILTAALDEGGAADPRRPQARASAEGRLTGTKLSVPATHVAARVLVPATDDDGAVSVYLVDPAGPGAALEHAETTSRQIHSHLTLDAAAGELLGRAGQGPRILSWLLDRAMVGLAAIQVGVCEEAVRMAAEYTSNRRQFGRPLSSFQGAALKAADAYIDTEAIRVTMLEAAWRLAEGLDASRQAEVAKWWAAEGGQRVVHTTQHLHGGMGADIDYPVHRYFLWGKQIETMLGGPSATLAALGQQLAAASP